MSSRVDEKGIAAAQRMLDEAMRRRAQRRAAEDAKWAEYKRQLALSTPHEGGAAHRRKRRVIGRF